MILDQSGQILSIQLHDLARDSRSRSRSISTPGREPTPAASEVLTNGSDDDKSGSDAESSDSESPADDESITMLVPDFEAESVSQAGRSPRSGSMEVDMDLETTNSEEDGDNDPQVASPEPLEVDLTSSGARLMEEGVEPATPSIPYVSKMPLSMDLDVEVGAPSLPSNAQDPQATIQRPRLSYVPSDSIATPTSSLMYSPTSLTSPLHASPVPESAVDAPPDIAMADIDTMPPRLSADITAPIPPSATSEAPSGDATPAAEDDIVDDELTDEEDTSIPYYLRPYAVAPIEWDPQSKVKPPLLLRGTLRPYQQAGLEWLASIHTRNLNGILADEMGLGQVRRCYRKSKLLIACNRKTIQTIALLAHLACDRGIWGPHLIIVPTSVLLNWEMEFKKFLPGFKVLSYHGNTKQRKELRQGWNNKYHFNVCITSYTLASRDSHVFKRKRWYYMILDEAHMIKNFKSQRWNILLMFRSFRRLLLTGTPLQNNLTELWALLQFLMSGTDFANLKEFGEWFASELDSF